LGKPALSQPRRILIGSCTLPSWSPDGSKLAFDFRSPQRGYEVWMMDAKRLEATDQQNKTPVTAWPVAAFDGFDGRLDLPWKPIRHDPTHVSLDKHPGKLTITTQRGSIHGKQKQDDYGGGIQAKNLFVIDSPFCNGEDFAMTTCVENFTPQTPYQQAGLICYDDDDNYLKWGYEFCWPKGAGRTFTCVREIAAKSNFDVADAEPGITKYWLRIIKRGNKYQYAYSYDGEDYVTVGEQTWGDGKPKKLGLLAKNGGNPDAPELECQFDFFQLQCPNEEKSINWDRGSAKKTDSSPASPTEEGLPDLTVYQLKYARAEAMVEVLASVFAGPNNGRIVADARTNAVVVFGTAEQQKKIQQAIRLLDVPTGDSSAGPHGSPFGDDVEHGTTIDAIKDNLADPRLP
jgi:hypothetical protein